VRLEWRRIEGGATVLVREQQVTLSARPPVPRSFFLPAGTEAPSFELGRPVRAERSRRGPDHSVACEDRSDHRGRSGPTHCGTGMSRRILASWRHPRMS